MGISKDADKMLCYIYKIYLERRKNGTPKNQAYDFSLIDIKNDRAFESWNKSDIDEVIMELSRAKYIQMWFCGPFRLEDDTIIYMENRFKNGLKEVLDFLGKFTSLIP